MADEHDDELLLDDPIAGDGDDEQDQQADAATENEEEEEFPTFDGDGEESETELIKHLRQQIRDRDKRLAAGARQQAEEPIVIGPRPKIEDFDYDAEAHDKALDAYEERKEAKRRQDERVEQAKTREAETWQQLERNYAAKRAALPYRDKDEVERVAFEALSPAHQALIADVAPDPALFVYAAGKHPGRLNELAAYDLNDPRQVVKMAAAVGRMGAGLSMKKRAKPPEPQSVVRGGVVRQGGDKELERLEKEADRTGDRTALIKYRKQQRQA